MKDTHACRCCLSETCYKDISNEYYHSGYKEVYANMLIETFNINITYVEESGRLICEECILQLRNAAMFRKQILHAEKVMNKMTSLFIDSSVPPKLEYNDDFIDHITGEFCDESDHDDDFGWHRDDASNGDDEELFLIKLEPTDQARQCNEVNIKSNIEPTVDRESFEGVCDEGKCEMGGKTAKRSKDKPENTSKKKSKSPKSQSQTDMKQNSLKLLNNSNICLFDSLKTKFRCFYCKESYLNIADLRSHATTHSNQRYLKMCINRLQGMSFKNVDISDLTCKLCSQNLKDLSHLKNHLIEEHKIEFSNQDHLLIPYKLENGNICVLCEEQFNTFYRLSVHMNTHYTNNVCEICGVSYINRISLRMHVHSLHREKKCSVCSMTFQNNYSRIKHMRKMHNTSSSKRYCLLCNKTFPYTYMLNEHKVQEHGAKRQLSSCIDCGKSFLTPQNLRIHIRSVHIRERNYACSLCGMRFFTKCDQRRHERTHQDVRLFSCSYCEGRFKSKDSLRRHLRRQHAHLFVSIN